ncbi:MAG TPA: type IV secretion protein IcmB [Patescibacteria group bacterium]|nr:type IV secretion protein IcmB [Patescibacteria group bacterium]
MGWFGKIFLPFQTALRQSVESFIRLETSDDETTLVAEDGSLVTMLRIDGSRQVIGQTEYEHIITGATLKVGARMDRQGHAIQVFFARDPKRIRAYLEFLIKPSRIAARNMGLEVDDVFGERIDHMSKFLSYEECYYVLWTRSSVLTKSERERAAKESKEKKWVQAGYAQNPLAALDSLRNRHKTFVVAVTTGLDELGIKSGVLEVHDALLAIRNNLFPGKANEKWRACLPGDPIPPRAPSNVADLSDIMWPPLRQQIVSGDAKVVSEIMCKIGAFYWGGADMTLGPMEASPFPQLLNRLFDADIPYRISFLIEGGGSASTAFRGFLATIMGVTNSLNKQIKFSLEGLAILARREPVVRVRISFATWADTEELCKDRLSALIQSVESWGYCQVSEFSGDPLDCVMSSALGIHCAGTAPTAVAPMLEIMKLLPWQRPSSPFQHGAILLRTPDGKVWPYQTGTNVTTTWFDLVFAQPGAGKSVLLNTLNLGTCLSPGLQKLPFVAVVDIGPSSSGLISLVKEALPSERQHEAAYYRLQMAHKFSINPFDTQLGCRYPLVDERSYLVELLTLLCTPPGHEKPYDGIQQLSSLVVDEMFRWRNDTAANAEPRPYLPRLDAEVDENLAKFNVHLPSDPYWWDVVDKMFDLGQYHIAGLAQRHACPTLTDAITASRRPQIRGLLEETSVGFSTEGVINAFERMITTSIRELPILSSVTQFDISHARVCSLDLMDVAPQGDAVADRQTSIMYMLARHVLVRSWWMGKDSLQFIPPRYREYHEQKLQEIGESPKRLCYDEFHRTSSSGSVRGQIIRDVREGRKRGVQIILASQLLDDFSQDMIDLATGVWVLGTAISDAAVQNVVDRFGLSDTARDIIRFKLTGPKAGGAPALFVLGTTEGRYEQYLINTLGPIELWAVSTSAEDVAIRTRLYQRLGAGRARQMLATAFPNGSARNEIKRRVMMKAEKENEAKGAMTSAVINEIVEDLVVKSEVASKQAEIDKFKAVL